METIGIIFGGPTSEYEVSLENVGEFLENVERADRAFEFIGISREGTAYYYRGPERAIWEDTWMQEEKHELFARVSQEGRLFWRDDDGAEHELHVDACLSLIMGAYGEDGILQGLLQALGLPLIGCSVAASAVGFDKDLSHKVAWAAGVRVPSCVVCHPAFDDMDAVRAQVDVLGYPVYVKPARGGSSLGITKVERPEDLAGAIKCAMHYDEKVLVEENIVGVEVGLSVIGNRNLVCGKTDQVNTVNHFFSYEDKYLDTGESPIMDTVDYDDETAERIRDAALTVYRALGCTGFARVDLFLDEQGNVIFNEINTVPWLPAHGRFSKMLLRAGYSMHDIMELILTAR